MFLYLEKSVWIKILISYRNLSVFANTCNVKVFFTPLSFISILKIKKSKLFVATNHYKGIILYETDPTADITHIGAMIILTLIQFESA